MGTTWQEIKLTTMQKMFGAQGSTIPNDTSTRDYIAAMPGVANEALQRLATAGKFIKKYIDIAHNPIKNHYANGQKIRSIENGEMLFYGSNIHSFYFEYFGACAYTIKVGDVEGEPISLEKKSGYSSVKGLIYNPDNKDVVLKIASVYPIAVKNFAFYTADFPSDEEVPTFAEKVRYPLKSMREDFYELSSEDIYYEGDADISRYKRTSDYFQEGNTVLVLDRDTPGNFRVYYNAYPPKITLATADDYELPIDEEVAVLMPLYMASELYKDDDLGMATQYRNEFEVGLEDLKDRKTAPSSEKFTSESGWI